MKFKDNLNENDLSYFVWHLGRTRSINQGLISLTFPERAKPLFLTKYGFSAVKGILNTKRLSQNLKSFNLAYRQAGAENAKVLSKERKGHIINDLTLRTLLKLCELCG